MIQAEILSSRNLSQVACHFSSFAPAGWTPIDRKTPKSDRVSAARSKQRTASSTFFSARYRSASSSWTWEEPANSSPTRPLGGQHIPSRAESYTIPQGEWGDIRGAAPGTRAFCNGSGVYGKRQQQILIGQICMREHQSADTLLIQRRNALNLDNISNWLGERSTSRIKAHQISQVSSPQSLVIREAVNKSLRDDGQ